MVNLFARRGERGKSAEIAAAPLCSPSETERILGSPVLGKAN